MDLARQIAMELLDIQAVYLRPQQPSLLGLRGSNRQFTLIIV